MQDAEGYKKKVERKERMEKEAEERNAKAGNAEGNGLKVRLRRI
jgi:hypothetical protein